MVLDVLIDMLWMFGAFCLFWWIMESPSYDFEELIELVMQASELMEAFWVRVWRELSNIQWDWSLSYVEYFEPRYGHLREQPMFISCIGSFSSFVGRKKMRM